MNGFWQDVRYAWRMLIKDPGFTAVVVIALGLGIGCSTTIFSVVNAILLRGQPFPESDRLVAIETRPPGAGTFGEELSFPDLLDLAHRSRTLSGLAGYHESMAYLTLGQEPERFQSAVITPGTLRTLGVTPARGREFLADEGVDGNQFASVIISHRIWKNRLASDPSVMGRTFRINGRVRTVVGIMPSGIQFPENADFWIPLAYKPAEDKRGERYVRVIGRLAPGVTLEKARAEFAGIGSALEKEHPETNEKTTFSVRLLHERMTAGVRPAMIMLMAAVGFVLLIACANVANLMLARAAGRQREIGLRAALGAGRLRIVRQLLTESVMVSLAGAGLGILIAYWSNDIVIGSIPIELPYWMKFGIDANAMLFAVAVAVGSGLLFGLAPALHLARPSLQESLKEGSSQAGTGRGHHRVRGALVVAEVALALVLLAGAGLMIRSFLRMQDQRAGLDPQGVLAGTVTLPVAVYPEDQDRRRFFEEFLPAVAALPGVESVSATVNLPLGSSSWSRTVYREGQVLDPNERGWSPAYAPVAPGFFSTLRIPLRAGRDFTAADRESTLKVAIVNQSAARRMWPGENAIGKRFSFGRDTDWRTVVGVVGDVRQNASEGDRIAQVYVPHAQHPVQTLSLVLRARGNPAALATPVRRLLQARDPDLPFYEVHTLPEAMRLALWEPRIYAALMGFYAVIALVIAAVGIYGVMAYNVAQRTREIGIRMALGAARGAVLGMVVGQGMRLTALGLGLGLAAAFGVTRLMAGLVFGVSTSDPPTFLGVLVILAGSAWLACWLPAHRATQIDPIVALRSE